MGVVIAGIRLEIQTARQVATVKIGRSKLVTYEVFSLLHVVNHIKVHLVVGSIQQRRVNRLLIIKDGVSVSEFPQNVP